MGKYLINDILDLICTSLIYYSILRWSVCFDGFMKEILKCSEIYFPWPFREHYKNTRQYSDLPGPVHFVFISDRGYFSGG